MKYALHIFALSIGLLLIMDPNYGYQTIVNTLIFGLLTSNAMDIRKHSERAHALRLRINVLEIFIEKSMGTEKAKKILDQILEKEA